MDSIEEQILDAIKDIRSTSKWPDTDSIFKYISNKSASNLSLFDIGKVLDDLKSKAELKTNQQKKEWIRFL